MITELISILIIALLVQQVVDTIKKAVKFNKGYAYLFKRVNLKVIIAMTVSIIVCVSSNIGVFTLLGINILPVFDNVLTGIIVSGGASSIQNMIKKINDVKDGK